MYWDGENRFHGRNRFVGWRYLRTVISISGRYGGFLGCCWVSASSNSTCTPSVIGRTPSTVIVLGFKQFSLPCCLLALNLYSAVKFRSQKPLYLYVGCCLRLPRIVMIMTKVERGSQVEDPG
jgi:hypothetical protein